MSTPEMILRDNNTVSSIVWNCDCALDNFQNKRRASEAKKDSRYCNWSWVVQRQLGLPNFPYLFITKVERDPSKPQEETLSLSIPLPWVFMFSSPCSPRHCAPRAQKYTAESLRCTEALFRWNEESCLTNSASKPLKPRTRVSPE